MRNRGLAATVVILLGVVVTLLVVLFVVKLPSFLSIQEIKDMLGDQKKTETTVRKKDSEITYVPEPSYTIETYNGYNGHVIIEYPHITGLSDTEGQDKVNYRIMMNALSIVPLYPISTAVQELNIKCDVKEFNENCIVICYSGTVMGKNVKTVTETIRAKENDDDDVYSGGAGYSSGGNNGYDPYLNGFIDPLGGGGTIISQTQATYNINRTQTNTQQTTNNSIFSSNLPKPVNSANAITQTSAITNQGSSNTMLPSYITPTSSYDQGSYSAPYGAVTGIGSTTMNQSAGVDNPSSNYLTAEQARDILGDKSKGNTSDSGPTTTTITAPTAKSSANYTNSNISSNSPSPISSGNSVNYTGGSQYPTSGNTQYSSSAPISYDSGASGVMQSNIPISGTYQSGFPSNNNQYNGQSNLPIYSQASTNKAATVNERIFYTNTIDLKTGRDVSLNEIADVNELAKYARSNEVELIDADPTMKTEIKNYIKKLSLNSLIKDLTSADFNNKELKTWPKSFSYKDGSGSTYFTVKLTSKLGSYVIIKYN